MSAVAIEYGGSTGRTPASTMWGLYLPLGEPLGITNSATAGSAVSGANWIKQGFDVDKPARVFIMWKGARRGGVQSAPAASASAHSVIDPLRKPFDRGSDQIHRLVSKLKSYSGFTANWDRDGASSPDKEAINAALKFLTFVPIGAGVPNVMLLASGEPAFYWEFDDVYAEIGFDPQGQFYAYAEKPGWAPVHMDDIPIKQGFPEKVFELLRRDQLQFTAE